MPQEIETPTFEHFSIEMTEQVIVSDGERTFSIIYDDVANIADYALQNLFVPLSHQVQALMNFALDLSLSEYTIIADSELEEITILQYLQVKASDSSTQHLTIPLSYGIAASDIAIISPHSIVADYVSATFSFAFTSQTKPLPFNILKNPASEKAKVVSV